MAFQHGKALTLSLDNSGGTPVVFTTYITDVSMNQSRDTAETTTIGATGDAKTYVAGFSDSTLTVNGLYDATPDAQINGMLGTDTALTWDYSPDAGTTSYTGEALVTGYNLSGGVGGAQTFTLNLQTTGAVTRT